MIARIWHGYTTHEDADTYEELLINKIFPHIANKKVTGYHRIELLKRIVIDEVEFITIMWFASLESVKEFAGEDYKLAFVLPEAEVLLKRYEFTSQHYTVEASINYTLTFT